MKSSIIIIASNLSLWCLYFFFVKIVNLILLAVFGLIDFDLYVKSIGWFMRHVLHVPISKCLLAATAAHRLSRSACCSKYPPRPATHINWDQLHACTGPVTPLALIECACWFSHLIDLYVTAGGKQGRPSALGDCRVCTHMDVWVNRSKWERLWDNLDGLFC
jgi:hypothetical protein